MNNKLIMLALLSASLFTYSCNDDESTEPSSEYLGEWTISKIEKTSCETNGVFPMVCSELTCEKITFKSNGQYEYTQTINSVSNSHSGTFLITNDGYLEICRQGLECNSYEIVHEPGSNTFKTIDLDGATGCKTEVTYTKVEQ